MIIKRQHVLAALRRAVTREGKTMNPVTAKVLGSVCLTLVACAGDVLAQKPPYDVFPPAEPPYYRVRYEASTEPGELIYPVTFTVWLPQDVKALRGVIVHQHGCGEGSCKSGLTGAYDLHWQALAKKHDCALLAPSYEQPEKADCQMWCNPRNGSDAAFQKALADLGAMSGHPELATVPWALWGHSGGGHWSGGMALLHPERVAAAWLRSGVPLLKPNPERPEIKTYTLPDAALKVPLMCNLGTKEGVTVSTGRFARVWPANEAFFTEMRAKGGRVGVAVDPLTSHECGNQRYLAIPWLDACLSARLPKTSGGPLQVMPTDPAWLAPILGTEAFPAAAFSGDPLKAAWLPNEAVARAWMQYVKDTAVTDTTPPPAPANLRVTDNVLTWEAEADFESGLARFVIERDGQFLATVPEKDTNPFGRPLFQNLQYSDTPAQPLVQPRYVDLAAEPGKPHRYRVIAVNTAGLRSTPSLVAESLAASAKPNILFIAVDDLRTELGCYGIKEVRSPNIDRLAAQGTVFDRAYCQQAVCSPSRTSLLTGCRPDTTRVYDLETHFRTNLPHVVTLPQHFKNNGYFTRSVGKIYHGGLDDQASWSQPAARASRPMYLLQANKELVARKAEAVKGKTFKTPSARYNAMAGPAWECADVPDNAYSDGAIADAAIEMLREAKEKPFFLAVGFLKPHLPFIAPKKYWDLYRSEAVPTAPNPFPPKGATRFTLADWGELRAYDDIPRPGPLTEEQARTLKHGYYACVSYMDAQLGRVLDELDRLGLRERTVVVLWGDHGWKLGEHGAWCKHSNLENDTHAPLLCSAPGQKSAGSHSRALVEFVDIYPSLCELAGLPLPEHLEGTSFAPLLDAPDRPWKPGAFSQYPRGKVMGYSLRTERYRLTRWVGPDGAEQARELYDQQEDPQENENIAERPENRARMDELTRQLEAGWKAVRTPADR